MSGGSYDYFEFRMREVASNVRDRAEHDPRWLAYAQHLDRLSEIMHAVEWADSGDWGREHAHKLIDETLGASVGHIGVEHARHVLQQALAALTSEAPAPAQEEVLVATTEFDRKIAFQLALRTLMDHHGVTEIRCRHDRMVTVVDLDHMVFDGTLILKGEP